MFTFGISTILTSDRDVFACIELIRTSSFKFVEIRCEKGHFDYDNNGEIKRLKNVLRKNNLQGVSLHPPLWVDIANKDEWTRVKSVREAEKVILVAKKMNIPRIILHPGKSAGDMGKAFLSVEELLDFANEWDVQIILENTFPDDFGSRLKELQSISDKFNMSVCIDTSHASTKGNRVDRFLEIFGGKIKHFHLSDSRMGNGDDHLIPYEGQINWEPVLDFLHTHDGFAVFEIPQEGGARIVEKLEKIKNEWGNKKISP
jgi:sugar phosphate isomerase/epimerase